MNSFPDKSRISEDSQPLIESKDGYFGEFGGAYIPEILHGVFAELRSEFEKIKADPSFWTEYVDLCRDYCGRPTPLTIAGNFAKAIGRAKIFIKREDLNHTGSHKVNNVIGQGLLVKRMGKKRIIAETGAGQHGLATATMAAKFGLDCTIYMGAKDIRRQRPNVFWMEKMGAKVVPVENGSATLKDAINEAMRDWSSNPETTHYVLGTACGPHPFPEMVAYFHSIIGRESRLQFVEQVGKLPDAVFACVGGGSNATGVFSGFISDDSVRLIGVEAGGIGPNVGEHAARIHSTNGKTGIAQGYKTIFLQNSPIGMSDTQSVSAGLDYIGISPILADLFTKGRVEFISATDKETVNACSTLIRTEGIIPALESSHAIAGAIKLATQFNEDANILINLSGRGDKDIFTVADAFVDEKWEKFIADKHEFYQSR